MKWIVLAYISSLVVTCGQKGPLQLPDYEEKGTNAGRQITQSILHSLPTPRLTERTMTP
jgi:predicted small lipoprotein YifL